MKTRDNVWPGKGRVPGANGEHVSPVLLPSTVDAAITIF